MNSSALSHSGFRRDAHPMAILCGVVGALSLYHDSLDISDEKHREIGRLDCKNANSSAMSYNSVSANRSCIRVMILAMLKTPFMMFGNP